MSGKQIPTATASRNAMLPDVPKAKETLDSLNANDLLEIIFGEDA